MNDRIRQQRMCVVVWAILFSMACCACRGKAGPVSSSMLQEGDAGAPAEWEFGSLLYTVYSSSNEVSVWLLAGDQPPRRLAEGDLPRLSPDGCSLLYMRDTRSKPMGSEYVVLDVPMTAERFRFSGYELWNTGVYDIAWSPDSIHLALTLGGTIKRFYSGNLWLLNTSDGATTQVTSSGGGEPLYSPDGKWIATSTPHIGWSHGSVGLWGAEGQGGRALFEPISSHSKMWAADSSGFSLALTRIGSEGSELWWVPVDGDPVQLSSLPVDNANWLASGTQYVYYTDRLRRANWDGSGDEVVPGMEGLAPGWPQEGRGLSTGPWSPDGRRLFAHDPAGRAYIVDADGQEATLRLSVERVHGWLDDGHYLASTLSEGRTTLYACALPESCRLLAQIEDEMYRMQYVPQRCTRTHDIPVLPSPTPEENDIPALIDTLLHGSDHGARAKAAIRLGGFGARDGIVPALAQAMQEDPTMRWAICEGLHAIGPDAMEAVPALIEALEDGCNSEDKTWCAVERGALVRTLPKITGQDFGEDAAAWRAWWEARQNH